MCPLDQASGHDGSDQRSRTRTRLKGVSPVQPPAQQAPPKAIGRYEVLQVIGKGAMGVVYKARDPLLDRIVAVKTIHAPSSLSKSVRKAFFERFEREAKAAARISHPAIVTIFDVGLAEEAPFLVMEYLPGETLADRLDRGVRLPLSQSVQCARDLASALGFAHRERIVHRDVKPANVLHAGDARWKLTDFGIARLPDSDLTQIGMFMGTPGYAPPEAIREGRYTAQADVFAWGAVLYELLCGRVPYEGPDTQTTNGYVLKAEAPSPKIHDAAVPEPLAQVALRALAHDTKKRFQNGAEADGALAEAWEKSLAGGLVAPTGAAHPAPPLVPPKKPAMPQVVATRVRDEEPTVVDLDAGKRAAEDMVTTPWTRVEDDPAPHPMDGSPLFAIDAVPTRIDAEKSRPRDDSAQKVIRTPLPEISSPLVPAESPSRMWVTVAVVLSLLALAAVCAFYLVRG
jgi:eukaryotic-like serine/threonine-protein kinase